MPIDSCLCCSALFMLFEKRCADATSVFSDYQLFEIRVCEVDAVRLG